MPQSDIPVDVVLRAVTDLRTEMAASLARMEERTVQRGEYAAQLGALEHRVSVLEASKTRVITALIYPTVVAVLAAVVTWLLATGNPHS